GHRASIAFRDQIQSRAEAAACALGMAGKKLQPTEYVLSANCAIVVPCLDGQIERSLQPRARRLDVAPLELDTANRRQGHREIRQVAEPRKFRHSFRQVLAGRIEVSVSA